MPHKFIITNNPKLEAAPNVTLQENRITFELKNSDDQKIPNADVEFHVMYGGGLFLEYDNAAGLSNPIPKFVSTMKLKTDNDGKIKSPEFKMGPERGPNGILVQSEHASKETIIFGSYKKTRLQLLSPAPDNRVKITRQLSGIQIKAVDKSDPSVELPVPDLPIEINLSSGSATLSSYRNDDNFWYPYLLQKTNFRGYLTKRMRLGNRKEACYIYIRAFWIEEIPRIYYWIRSDTPNLADHNIEPNTSGSLDSQTPNTVMQLLRPETNNSVHSGHVIFHNSNLDQVVHLFMLPEEKSNPKIISHTGGTPSDFYNDTIFAYPTRPGNYKLELRLPDFPDSHKLTFVGSIPLKKQGSIPTVNGIGNPDVYNETWGGGNTDPTYQIKEAGIFGSPIQFLGPNQRTKPFRIFVDVDQTYDPNYYLHLLTVKFKTRTSPAQSVIDEPTFTDMIPGKISKSVSGPWTDEFETDIPGSPGRHFLNLYFASNHLNHDTHVEITATAMMKRINTHGTSTYERDKKTTIKLRVGIPRPRIYFTKQTSQNTFEPITESGIIPMSFEDRNGNPTNPPAKSKFFVELRSHDVGTSIKCRVTTEEDAKDITLKKVQTTPEFVLYRSNPCYVYSDSKDTGIQSPPIPPNIEMFRSRGAKGTIFANITHEMPNNTEPTPYYMWNRPVSSFNLVDTGEGNHETYDKVPKPVLLVDIKKKIIPTGIIGIWEPTIVSGGGTMPSGFVPAIVTAKITGKVFDILGDNGGQFPTEITINSTTVPITEVSEVIKTRGRTTAKHGEFEYNFPLPWGLSFVRISVKNELGEIDEKTYQVEVTAKNNDLMHPQNVIINVRPLGNSSTPRSLPHLHFLCGEGTNLGQGTAPSQITGLVRSLDPQNQNPVHSKTILLERGNTKAPYYFSKPFFVIRKDLKLPRGQVHSTILLMPPGGRIEWSTNQLPNITGNISLTNRLPHRHTKVKILKQNQFDPNIWEEVKEITRGDIIKVEMEQYPPGQPNQIDIGFADSGRRTIPGEMKDLLLFFTQNQSNPNKYDLTKYQESNSPTRKNTTEIKIIEEFDDAPRSGAFLRIHGSGFIVVGPDVMAGQTEISIPCSVKPKRFTRNGSEILQEILVVNPTRIGALGTVVPGSGEFVFSAMDRSLSGRNLEPTMERSYRSANDYPGPLGHGWNHNWNVFLYREDKNHYSIMMGNGKKATFRKRGSSVFPPAGIYAEFKENNNWFQVKFAGGITMTFGQVSDRLQNYFPLIQVEDRFRNRVQLRYDSTGKLALILDEFDNTLQFIHKQDTGRLETFGDYEGNSILYKYYDSTGKDGHEGNLKGVRSPIIRNPENPFPDGRLETYGYYNASKDQRLHWIQSPNNNAALTAAQAAIGGSSLAGSAANNVQITSLGKYLEIEYYQTPQLSGHVKSQTFGKGTFSFTPSDFELTVKDRIGNTKIIDFTRYRFGPPGFAKLPRRLVARDGNQTLKTSYFYNTHGEIKEEKFPMGNKIEYKYDDAGDSINRGNLLEMIQHPRPQPNTSQNSSSRIMENTINVDPEDPPKTNNVDKIVTTYKYEPEFQQISEVKDPMGNVITYEYKNGFLKTVTFPKVSSGGLSGAPQERREYYEWNNWGQLIKKYDPNNVITMFAYYKMSNPISGRTDADIEFITPHKPGGLLAKQLHDVKEVGAPVEFWRSAGLAPIRMTVTRFEYDRLGNSVKTYPKGMDSFTQKFNEVGEIIEANGPLGEKEQFKYDADGNLVETKKDVFGVEYPADLPPFHKTITTELKYDTTGNLIEKIDDATRLKLKTTWEYDENENKTFEHSPVANAHADGDYEKDNKTRYDYDGFNRLKLVTVGGGGDQIIKKLEYDENDNVTKEQYYKKYSDNSRSHHIDFIYDAFDRLISAKTPLSEMNTSLDIVGNIVSEKTTGIVDPESTKQKSIQEIFHYYDEAYREVAQKINVFEYELQHSANSTTNPQIDLIRKDIGKQIHKMQYDKSGNVIKTIDQFGNEIHTEPDGHGNIYKTRDSFDNKVTFTYNKANKVSNKVTKTYIGTSSFVTSYDKSGRITEEKKNGKLLKKFTYDSIGRRVIQEDPLGNRVRYYFDGAGRLDYQIHEMYPKGTAFLQGQRQQILYSAIMRYKYTENGKLREIYNAEDLKIESYQYNNFNAIKNKKTPFKKNSLRWMNTEYNYREDGLVDTITNPNGHLIKHEYDEEGKLKERTVEKNNSSTAVFGTTKQKYVWNGLGQLIEGHDNNGYEGTYYSSGTKWSTVFQRYNSLGQVIHAKQTSTLPMHIDKQGYEIKAKYSENGNLEEITSPKNIKMIFKYDKSLLDEIRGPANIKYAKFNYVKGILKSRKTDGDITYTLDYNSQHNKIKKIKIEKAGSSIFEKEITEYNELGFPKKIKIGSNRYLEFEYDSQYRQVQELETNDIGSREWSKEWTKRKFSKEGNLKTVENEHQYVSPANSGNALNPGWIPPPEPKGKISSEFNEYNQIISKKIEDDSDTKESSFEYDKMGNLKSDGKFNYTFDFQNRLVEVNSITPGGNGAHYAYDIFGRRVNGFQGTEGVTTLAWFGNNIVGEYPSSQNLRSFDYFYAPHSSTPLGGYSLPETSFTSQNQQELSHFFFTDASNDIVKITSSNGEVFETTYENFENEGKPNNSGIAKTSSFYRHGMYLDPDVGIYLAGKRTYHPGIGTFMQRDPSGPLYDPLAYGNSYTFAASNQIAFNDTGNFAFLAALVGFGIGFIANSTIQFYQNGDVNWGEALLAGVFGSIGGIGGSIIRSLVTNVGLGVAHDYTASVMFGKSFSMSSSIFSSTLGMAGGLIVSAGLKQILRKVKVKPNELPLPPATPKGFYHPRTMRREIIAGRSGVISQTVTPTGRGHPNVRLHNQYNPNQLELVNEYDDVVRVIRIVHDERGFPIFDDYAKFTTRIDEATIQLKKSRKHMAEATRHLKRHLDEYPHYRKDFTPEQLSFIDRSLEVEIHSQIPGLTWHHHQHRGVMQLVPTKIHKLARHIGGDTLWFR